MLMRNDGVFEVGCDVLPMRQAPRLRVLEHAASKRCVGLLIDRGTGIADGVLRGVGHYLKEVGGWRSAPKTGRLPDGLLAWLKQWQPDGVLLLSDDPDVLAMLQRVGVPAVVVGGCGSPQQPSVWVDEAEVGRLAARHLLERSIRSFGVVDISTCAESFQREVETSGYECETLPGAGRERLQRWIRTLPKPVGIFADSDERGLTIIDACESAGVNVPEEVAVMGVGNDHALCELASPTLSSVDLNAETLGYEAAALLDRVMDGELVEKTLYVAPRGVVARRSTDSAVSDDEDVTRAIRYIQAKACEGLQVSDVLAHMAMSRGSLQQRIKQSMGRTIHQEIHRVRLERAKDLLANSGLAVKQVAKESGFASVQYMTRVFRAGTGETPASYRRRRSR